MTAPESFVSRWARLKREADVPRDEEGAAEALPFEVTAPPAPEPGAASPGHQAEVVEPFDPASLPPVDAIQFDTDIRPFLQGRVPAALTRAALRQAWTSDPVIRDFIGIAENQWDFNDPAAIPGFGPLLGEDNVQSLFEQAIGLHRKFAETMAEMPLADEHRQSDETERQFTTLALDQTARPASDGLTALEVEVATSTDNSNGEAIGQPHPEAADKDQCPSGRRSHGGALPR
jgi:Protein of unknown function (DUF3306)